MSVNEKNGPPNRLVKIVSGGQTGVDRAALDVAIYFDIPHGGWCPLYRRSEDGAIPEQYNLVETDSPGYATRTRRNVIDSDGTLVLSGRQISGGTALTVSCAKQLGRPLLIVNLDDEENDEANCQQVCEWLDQKNINVLNIAGPRESSSPGIGSRTVRFLHNVFQKLDISCG